MQSSLELLLILVMSAIAMVRRSCDAASQFLERLMMRDRERRELFEEAKREEDVGVDVASVQAGSLEESGVRQHRGCSLSVRQIRSTQESCVFPKLQVDAVTMEFNGRNSRGEGSLISYQSATTLERVRSTQVEFSRALEFSEFDENIRKYYAVQRGGRLGIYVSWEECKRLVMRFSRCQYKGFRTLTEAERYLGMKE